MLGEFGDEEGESALEDGSGVSFFSRSPAARMSVVAAGPVFNFILAFVFAWSSYPGPVTIRQGSRR